MIKLLDVSIKPSSIDSVQVLPKTEKFKDRIVVVYGNGGHSVLVDCDSEDSARHLKKRIEDRIESEEKYQEALSRRGSLLSSWGFK